MSHHTESLLDDARNGKLRITPAVADVILASKDYLERAFQQLASVSAGAPPQPFADNRALLERIDGVAKGGDASEAAQNAEAPPAAQVAVAEATPREAEAGGRTTRTESHTVKVDTAKLDYLVDMVGEIVIAPSFRCAAILYWPACEIARLPAQSCAGEHARRPKCSVPGWPCG